MTSRLDDLLHVRKCSGVIAIGQNMVDIGSIWNRLELSETEQEKWEIVLDTRCSPMVIKLMTKPEFDRLPDEDRQWLRTKYHDMSNRNEKGVWINK